MYVPSFWKIFGLPVFEFSFRAHHFLHCFGPLLLDLVKLLLQHFGVAELLLFRWYRLHFFDFLIRSADVRHYHDAVALGIFDQLQ